MAIVYGLHKAVMLAQHNVAHKLQPYMPVVAASTRHGKMAGTSWEVGALYVCPATRPAPPSKYSRLMQPNANATWQKLLSDQHANGTTDCARTLPLLQQAMHNNMLTGICHEL